jgi:hypothetical protein
MIRKFPTCVHSFLSFSLSLKRLINWGIELRRVFLTWGVPAPLFLLHISGVPFLAKDSTQTSTKLMFTPVFF